MTDRRISTQGSANPFSALIYYLVMIVLFPILLVGYVIWVIKAFGGKSGGSGTAQSPLFARWLQHQHGTRIDEPASRLMMVVPGIPKLGVRLVAFPMLTAHRISGFVPESFRYPFTGEITLRNQSTARQTYYDRAVEQHLPQMAQFVILGAGFDTRAFRLPESTRVRAFEIDTPETSRAKGAALDQAGIKRDRVALVGADFETEDWLVKLTEAGFDPDQRTLFICEGVLPYLDRAAVDDTFHKIASTASGSVVAFDYFSSEILESQAFMMRTVRASLNAGGEPLKFGVESTPPVKDQVAALVGAHGLALLEHHPVGDESNGKRALGGFAMARVA